MNITHKGKTIHIEDTCEGLKEINLGQVIQWMEDCVIQVSKYGSTHLHFGGKGFESGSFKDGWPEVDRIAEKQRAAAGFRSGEDATQENQTHMYGEELMHANKYVRQLRSEEKNPTAGFLLDIMRPEVDHIFSLLGILNPPSQSSRAARAIETLKEQQAKLRRINKDELTTTDVLFKQKIEIMNSIKLLEDFLAVWRVVWILEGRPL